MNSTTYNLQPTTYRLRLTVNNDVSTLKLQKGETLIMEQSWPEERDMGKQLLKALKSILNESGVKSEEIGEFLIDGETKDNFTSRRIAETVQRTFLFARKATESGG